MTTNARIWKLALLVAALSTQATAQQLPSVVQLPSFQTFSYSGSVVVPDSGAAYLGGNKSSSSSLSRRGFSRSFGFSQRNSQVAAAASIIDLDKIDRRLLGTDPQNFVQPSQGDRVKAADPTEEGKALVRFARRQYRAGKETAAFDTYRMAIGVLRGRLRELAKAEFRRVFGAAADQSLQVASVRR